MIQLTSTTDILETIKRVAESLATNNRQDLKFLTHCLALHNSEITLKPSDVLKILVSTVCNLDAVYELIELGEHEWIRKYYFPRVSLTTVKIDLQLRIGEKRAQEGSLSIFEWIKLFKDEDGRYSLNMNIPKKLRELIENQSVSEIIQNLPNWKSLVESNKLRSNCCDVNYMIINSLVSKLKDNWEHVKPETFPLYNWGNWFDRHSHDAIMKKYFRTMMEYKAVNINNFITKGLHAHRTLELRYIENIIQNSLLFEYDQSIGHTLNWDFTKVHRELIKQEQSQSLYFSGWQAQVNYDTWRKLKQRDWSKSNKINNYLMQNKSLKALLQ